MMKRQLNVAEAGRDYVASIYLSTIYCVCGGGTCVCVPSASAQKAGNVKTYLHDEKNK